MDLPREVDSRSLSYVTKYITPSLVSAPGPSNTTDTGHCYLYCSHQGPNNLQLFDSKPGNAHLNDIGQVMDWGLNTREAGKWLLLWEGCSTLFSFYSHQESKAEKFPNISGFRCWMVQNGKYSTNEETGQGVL